MGKNSDAAIGLDHAGIVAADLDAAAAAFTALGFHLTPVAAHASGRTANRCAMFRDGGYLELMATVPGQASATLDRFLARGPGAHILALDIPETDAAVDRLARAGIAAEASIAERDAGPGGPKARFAVIMPPDPPAGRVLLIRHLTRDLLWRPEHMVHPNGALALIEAVFATETPAETVSYLSRLTGRPAEPDPLGGYRIALARGVIRVLPARSAAAVFPGLAATGPVVGLTIAAPAATPRTVHAGGVALRFVTGGP